MSRLDQLKKLHEDDPADAEIPYMIAHELARDGAHAESLEWFDRCVEIEPGHCYAYYHKARSLESLDRLDEARDTLRAGLAQARRQCDEKAISEIEGYLSHLGGLD